ncbi:hypothetical protein DPMN_129464 [Dreissena polymorpha]|uniref:Uncharacterized protein n=1 Tax=Dreissena polymorpha TaxID=45954 RepID=A0A9D4H2P9_DREPO|nr:hypothetical protein DPMN_129464 [Dreissena polymorpha]
MIAVRTAVPSSRSLRTGSGRFTVASGAISAWFVYKLNIWLTTNKKTLMSVNTQLQT